jgi:hypothetical protein
VIKVSSNSKKVLSEDSTIEKYVKWNKAVSQSKKVKENGKFGRQSAIMDKILSGGSFK